LSDDGPVNQIFDVALARLRLRRAWRARAKVADFLISRAARELVERLALVRREFPVAIDLLSPAPHGAIAIAEIRPRAFIARAAPVVASVGSGSFAGFVSEAERIALKAQSCDLIASLLALQFVNDLPGLLVQIRHALKPDGLFLACIVGGDTLQELRQSLTAAEAEILSGASPRVAPFADVRALGGLLQRAGFALPVVDLDRVVVRYPDTLALARDLRAMGATNALNARSRRFLRRDVFIRASEIYAERFADADGRLRATFDLIWVSGWAPEGRLNAPLAKGG
jgi:SAM-dependent methyltransferase